MTEKDTRKVASKPAASADKGRRYRGVSEEARRAERRQRFIEAGLDVFGSRGYHSSTVRSICASAGLTERYFYESFENSEDLLCAVYHFCIQRLRERIMASLLELDKDPELMARTGLESFFAVIRDDPRLARVLFIEVLGVSDRVDMMYRVTVEDFAGLLSRLTMSLGVAALPPPLAPDILSNALIGAVVATASRWVILGFNTPIEDMVVNLQAIFTGALRHLINVADAHSSSVAR